MIKPRSRATAHRRLSRLTAELACIRAAMRAGARLFLHYQNGRELWQLSDGRFVTSDAAAIITTDNDVSNLDGDLFGGRGQTWIYTKGEQQ